MKDFKEQYSVQFRGRPLIKFDKEKERMMFIPV